MQKHDQIALAEKSFIQAFDKPSDPRSEEYKAGVRAALRLRLAGKPSLRPYKLGTAQDDAYIGGISEGHVIFRNFEECELSGPSAIDHLKPQAINRQAKEGNRNTEIQQSGLRR